jgi:excisionase family DNA binding protein
MIKKSKTSKQMQKKYMTVDDVAKYLSVSPATIYRWVTNRQIPYVPMHGCLRFIDCEIDEWMHKRSMGQGEKYAHLIPENNKA